MGEGVEEGVGGEAEREKERNIERGRRNIERGRRNIEGGRER